MYGLMMTSNGCPGDLWLSGWRRFDTEDTDPDNYFTDGIKNYLKGYFEIDDIETHFCIKNIPSFTSCDTSWPKGSYCILMYGGSCPSGFQSGFIQWNNEDNGNKNARGGTLPDGVYDSDTRIYFCCRNDGLTSTAISLPTDQPFILVRISTACQTVYGMGVTEVFVQWDEDDVDDASDPGGLHPYADDGFYNLRLYFCYYYNG
ncbi:hypothetical protein MAR_009632 [Mya arenaria]|uniref:Apextrin C-terminal domain-containing protein n=2 Tax=Mya arenaria TaxID=6604 RepID=A0ABY7E1M6_MYAAR|nr:hypothetical protein MAR_009632 [Mya arenaria]